jgi:translocator protein
MARDISRTRMLIGFALWLAITLAAGAIGSQFEPGEWFENLVKPSWNPPSWVFGPVWTLLYVLMAVAAWRIWFKHGFSGAPWALGLYFVQLVLNAAWSWFFFGLQNPGLAFGEIIVLWLVLIMTMLMFFRRSLLAGWLFIPYLAWVTFASALNGAIWLLN